MAKTPHSTNPGGLDARDVANPTCVGPDKLPAEIAYRIEGFLNKGDSLAH